MVDLPLISTLLAPFGPSRTRSVYGDSSVTPSLCIEDFHGCSQSSLSRDLAVTAPPLVWEEDGKEVSEKEERRTRNRSRCWMQCLILCVYLALVPLLSRLPPLLFCPLSRRSCHTSSRLPRSQQKPIHWNLRLLRFGTGATSRAGGVRAG